MNIADQTTSASTHESAALTVRNLVSGYGHTTVVRDVSITVRTGTATVLLGPNGAGKSTLLKTISGLIRPTSGSVMLGHNDVTTLTPNKRASLGLCHIPEGRGIFPSMTVKENLQLQAQPGGETLAIERGIAAFPVLGERLSLQAGAMSGGQQQMLSIARAYTQSPSMILVDEGSLGLAPIVVDEIFTFLAGITAAGASLLIVDQFVARALEIATWAYVMTRGEITFAGTSTELQDSDVFERYLGASS